MKYERFPVAESLRPFIECYYVWEGEAPERIQIQTPPSGYAALVINYGDPAWAFQDPNDVQQVPDAFVCGLFTSRMYRVLKGKIGMAGIVFKPSAIHNFFGVRMSQLVNNRMSLSYLVGEEEKALAEKIHLAESGEKRAQVLEKFALTYVAQASKKMTIIDEAVNFITDKGGHVSVADVAENFRISRRYLEKHFLEKVGISPKFYARIIRFSILSHRIAKDEKIDWQEIVIAGGYHDQSHLFKDFLEFNGVNPTEYRESHQELIRFLKR